MDERDLFAKAVDYGLKNIDKASKFKDFALSLIDLFGEGVIVHCKAAYAAVKDAARDGQFPVPLEFDSVRYVDSVSEELIANWWREYKEREEEKKRWVSSSGIDELTRNIERYRRSDEFTKMMRAVSRFHYLSPYNAMLVGLQKPGAQLVLTISKWRTFGRQPKPNAQNLITLIPFGPVQCMYDWEDTEPMAGQESTSKDELMDKWYSSLVNRATGKVADDECEHLMSNLSQYGIYLDDSFMATGNYGGYIGSCRTLKLIKVALKWDKEEHRYIWADLEAPLLLSVNRKSTQSDAFATICHELGHLFCRHVWYDRGKRRTLSIKEKEFEAETVAYLVCKRHGVKNPSEKYLATYAPDGEIPTCSIDIILKAVTEIEKMMKGLVAANQSTWGREDPKLKRMLKQLQEQ